jgi:hypothetical protein
MVTGGFWFRGGPGLDGSGLVPVRVWVERVNFWFGLILMVRLSVLIAGLILGVLLAVNEKWLLGFSLNVSVRIGEIVSDVGD